MGAEAEHVQKLIDEFEKLNSGIKVKVQAIPWTAAHEKLITAYASETTPDIFQLGNTWIPEFVALESLENLNGWIKNSSTIKKENYFPGIWETNVIDNNVYGVPWYVDTRVLFYRKDILAKAGYLQPPKTWEELYDLCLKIKRINPGTNKFAIFLPTNEWAPFIIFGLQAGAGLLKDNNSLSNFSDPKFKKAFSYLIKFYRDGLSPIGMTQVTNVFQAFEEGYFALYITGPWNVNEFRTRLPKKMQNLWMTSPLPAVDRNDYPGVSIAGGASLVIYKDSEHKNEAWKLVEFLSSKYIQLQFYKIATDLPAVKEAWKDSLLQNDIYFKAFYDQLQRVVPMPKVPEWEQIVFAKVQQYAEFAATGALSDDDALKALDNDVNKILEKRRWMLTLK